MNSCFYQDKYCFTGKFSLARNILLSKVFAQFLLNCERSSRTHLLIMIDYVYDYLAHSSSGLFSDQLHQVPRSLTLPTKLRQYIFTTIVILLS
jgi:hypothetical protein